MATTKLNAFFTGFIKIHILYHASRRPVFGLEMIRELARHGYEISPGTLYPALHSLEREGLLAAEQKLAGGKIRKYYTATPAGREMLAQIRVKLKELVEEVL